MVTHYLQYGHKSSQCDFHTQSAEYSPTILSMVTHFPKDGQTISSVRYLEAKELLKKYWLLKHK